MDGYKGDGKTCEIVPTEISFNGFSVEDEIILDPSQYPDVVASVKDIGPQIEHTYELVNRGPQTVGNLQARIHVSLKDKEGNLLAYMHEAPKFYIQDGYSGKQISRSCSNDTENSVNPRRLPRQAPNVDYAGEVYDGSDDYYADNNYGVVLNNAPDMPEYYDELSPEEKALLQSYDLPEYDYSHFENFESKENAKDINKINPSLLEQVSLDELQGGNAFFTCNINLAPGVRSVSFV